MAVAIFGDLGAGKLAQVAQNSAHVPAFGLIALLVLLWRRPRTLQPLASLHWHNYFVALGIAIAFGVLVEIVQFFLGRDAEVDDVIHDALGAVAALAAIASIAALGAKRRTLAVVLFVLSMATASAALYPLALATAAYVKRERQFPLLVEFDSTPDTFFWRPNTTDPKVMQMPANLASVSGETALYVPFVHGSYPGIEIEEVHGDWSGLHSLVLDVANPSAKPVRLTLRVHDRTHNFAFRDRFTRSVQVPAGRRINFEIALADIEAAPQGRSMDMRHISAVLIFSTESAPGAGVLLKHLWLK